MHSKSFVLGVVAGAAVASAVTFVFLNSHKSEGTSNSSVQEASKKTATENEDWKRENAELKEKLAAAQEQLKNQSETMRGPVAVKEVTPEAASAKKAAAKLALLYLDPNFRAALEGMDWDAAGDVSQKMVPLLADLFDALAKGEKMPSNVGDIQKLNGELVNLALKAQEAGVPGSGVNGSFTHPSISSNLLYAALEKAGSPLNADQRAQLQALTKRFSDEDAARLANYGPDAIELQKLIDETRLKDSFYKEWGSFLSPTQENVLYRDSVRGRTSGDIWSSGVVWSQYARPMFAENREQYGQQVAQTLQGQLNLSSSDVAQFNKIVSDWASRYPAEYFSESPDAYSQRGLMQVSRVRDAAERQLELQRMLLSQLNLSEAAQKVLKQGTLVGVPYKKP